MPSHDREADRRAKTNFDAGLFPDRTRPDPSDQHQYTLDKALAVIELVRGQITIRGGRVERVLDLIISGEELPTTKGFRENLDQLHEVVKRALMLDCPSSATRDDDEHEWKWKFTCAVATVQQHAR